MNDGLGYRVARGLLSIVRMLRNGSLRTITFAAPGHFYSPLPRLRGYTHPSPSEALPGLDLNIDGQLQLAEALSRHRFRPERWVTNEAFTHLDASLLAGMIQELTPSRIIEIGSGYSSAVMLDHSAAELTFIDPYPDTLREVMRPTDEATVITKPVQDVSLSLFGRLTAGDFLFVDSTHVVKVGSDVHRIIFDILPLLASGVVVHFHDIFWPFEYPEEWIREGRAWNEAYMLRAFLTDNPAWRIRLWGSWLEAHRRHLLPEEGSGAGSLWMQKL